MTPRASTSQPDWTERTGVSGADNPSGMAMVAPRPSPRTKDSPSSRFLTDSTVVPQAAATRRMVNDCSAGFAIKSWDHVGSRKVPA